MTESGRMYAWKMILQSRRSFPYRNRLRWQCFEKNQTLLMNCLFQTFASRVANLSSLAINKVCLCIWVEQKNNVVL